MFSLFGEVKLVNTREISMERVQKVSISYISESIFLYEADGDALILKEYLSQSEPSMFAEVFMEGDALTIRHGDRHRLLNVVSGYIEVYLPKAFFGTLNVNTISGKIQADARLSLSELAVSNTSGRIQLSDVMAGTAVLSTVSGSIAVASLRSVASVQTTSGTIRIAHAEGNGDFRSVSGSVELSFRSVTGDILAKSTSGRVRLGLPAGLSFFLDVSTVSGMISVMEAESLSGGKRAKSGAIGPSPQSAVRLSSISGRIDAYYNV